MQRSPTRDRNTTLGFPMKPVSPTYGPHALRKSRSTSSSGTSGISPRRHADSRSSASRAQSRSSAPSVSSRLLRMSSTTRRRSAEARIRVRKESWLSRSLHTSRSQAHLRANRGQGRLFPTTASGQRSRPVLLRRARSARSCGAKAVAPRDSAPCFLVRESPLPSIGRCTA